MLLGYEPKACEMKGICSCQFVIESDGGVYPCDFYVVDDWKLGNIKGTSIKQLADSEQMQKFIAQSRTVSRECKECKWFRLCRGGCWRNREGGSNYFCSAYKDFFDYAGEHLYELARRF